MRIISYFTGGKHRRGTAAVMTAVLLVFLMGMVAFAVDVGYILTRRTELSNAADAAVLAAAAVLQQDGTEAQIEAEGFQYLEDNLPFLSSYSGDQVTPYGRLTSSVEIGVWNYQTRSFTASALADANAVRLQSSWVDIPLFFAPVIGTDQSKLSVAPIAVGKTAGGPFDVMLLIDLSTSMKNNDRVGYAKQAAAAFVDQLESHDRVALAYFPHDLGDAGEPVPPIPAYVQDRGVDSHDRYGKLYHALTGDFTAVQSAISGISLSTPNCDGTPIGPAMEVALDYLRSNGRTYKGKPVPQYVVLLTDGNANMPRRDKDPGPEQMPHYGNDGVNHTYPDDAPFAYIDAQRAEAVADGVIFHVVQIATNSIHPNAIAQMVGVADATGGEHYEINSDSDLDQLIGIFEHLAEGPEGGPGLVR